MKTARRKPDVHLRHAIRRYKQWKRYDSFREQLRQAGDAFRYAVEVLMGRRQ